MVAATERQAPRSERQLPAWVFSCAFHATLVLLMGLAVERAPRGAADEPVRSAGIVLKRSSAEGDLYEGEHDAADRAEAPAEQLSPDELLNVLPSESAADGTGDDLPKLPAVGAGRTAAGGQSDAGQFTTGGGRVGTPTGDGDTRVRVFGVEGVGSKFVYVFDRSSSMEGAPLAAAKRQLVESLASLESVHQFHVIFFNHQMQSLNIPGGGRRIAFATERNKQLAANFVGGISADGGTDRFAALRAAVALQPDVVFFLTDADDPMSASELAQIDRLNRRARAAICTIEFGRGPRSRSENFLVQLSRQSGGQHGYIDTNRLAQ